MTFTRCDVCFSAPPMETGGRGRALVGLILSLVFLLVGGCGAGDGTDAPRFDPAQVDTTDVQFGPDSIATQDIHLHPTILLDEDQRTRLREVVRADTAAAERFRDVLARAVVALHRTPQPIDTLVYEGHLQRHPQRLATKKALLDMERMRALGYAYLVVRDDRYAEALCDYLLAWVDTTVPTGNPINANKLAAAIFAYDLVEHRLSAAQRARCRTWLESLARALIETTPDAGAPLSNWHTKRIKMVGLIGVALDHEEFRRYAVEQSRRFVSEALNADGTSQDFEKRDALEYHESALHPLVEITLTFGPRGRDLYRFEGEKGGSIARSVAFLLPFARGDTTHAEWVNSAVSFDRERYEAGQEHYRPGRLWDPKSSVPLFELASGYEPRYRALVDSLQGAPHRGTYPTWHTVVAAAADAAGKE